MSVKQNISVNDRVIVALDVETVQEAKSVVSELGALANFYKIGMQLQFNGGIDYAEQLANEGKKVFLDSKLFDIRNTVEKTVERISNMGVTFLTVHGDKPVIESAVRAKRNQLQILAVTFLTSLDEHDLRDMQINMSLEDFVLFRAKMAISAGADGVIASGLESARIRQKAGSQLKIITPGIRPQGTARDDQRRITTPRQAIEDGADYLVIGRPILTAVSKTDMLRRILAEVREALQCRQSAQN